MWLFFFNYFAWPNSQKKKKKKLPMTHMKSEHKGVEMRREIFDVVTIKTPSTTKHNHNNSLVC